MPDEKVFPQSGFILVHAGAVIAGGEDHQLKVLVRLDQLLDDLRRIGLPIIADNSYFLIIEGNACSNLSSCAFSGSIVLL